jgi:predicted acetyltransferase
MVNLRAANESDKELYKNLFNMYQNELSPYLSDLYSEVDENGYFDKDTVDCYFNDNENVFPFIITVNAKIAGCVVLSKPPYVKPGCNYCIQELFVLGLYRGKGVAEAACNYLMKKYKGKYCILVLKENIRAIKFWQKFISKNTVIISEEEYDEKSVAFEFVTK